MGYHVKFGSFCEKGVRINTKGTPKTGERWDPAPWGGSDNTLRQALVNYNDFKCFLSRAK